MSFLTTMNAPLTSIVWPVRHKMVKEWGLVALGISLLAIASQCVIPLQPVPLTFQSATVVFLGMLYGSRLASFSVLGYLILGTSGLPIFAGFSSGMNVFMGSTAGYLIGFFPAAWIAGYLAQYGFARSIITAFLSAVVSVSIIFLLGVLGLAHFIGLEKAISFGLMPFVWTEPLKLLVIASIIPFCWKK